MNHLINEQLTLSVGIPCVNEGIRLPDQLAQHPQLLRSLLFLAQLPSCRHDREMIVGPAFEGRVVGFRFGLLQKMSDAPAHDIAVAGADAAVFLPMRCRQRVSDCPPKTRLFCNVEDHLR